MGAAVGDDGRPQDGIWETLVSQWLLSGPLALQFACFDASSGIQQRIGELNHSGGGEEGEEGRDESIICGSRRRV